MSTRQPFNIRGMVERPRGSLALVPVIQYSVGLERAYTARLRLLLHEAARLSRELILPAYARKLTTDAEASDFAQMELVLRAIARTIGDQVADLMRNDANRHTKAWMAAARRAFGVDLGSVVKADDLETYLEAAAIRNAGLIKGLSDDVVKRVQTATTNALIAGDSVKKLQAEIKHQLGVSDSRAQLIAQDQTSKLTADLNRIRHQQAGIDDYIWRTSQDERVRNRHRQLEGNKYKYGEPTGAEEGLPPGQPIRCRCIAQAVVEF